MADIILIESDSRAIYDDMIAFHKEMTGEVIPAASDDSYIYSTVAAQLGIIKAEMNEVAVQNYLKYARGVRLDLKNMYGTRGERLGKNAGKTTMRCYISTAIERNVIIPAGTRFIYKKYVFSSEKEGVILKGELYTDIQVECEVAGDIGTILKGEIIEIVDRYDYYQKCENITDVTGGRDEEADEDYRKRLQELPESFTSAGSEGAYKFWVKKASPLVTDVVIQSPSENVLDIYVCNNNETISSEEKKAILDYISQEDIKALNDKITIKDPEIYEYNININYIIYKDSKISRENLENSLKEKLNLWANNKKIGESLNIQDIIALCKEEETIKKVEIIEPAEYEGKDISLCVLKKITLNLQGSEER